ncbi:MAG: DUF3352 domain-containing protein [Sedimentisphaerales bacterium]|nr:DUF3352 domain-containing protein [Sedimentisphaerales bacterium]
MSTKLRLAFSFAFLAFAPATSAPAQSPPAATELIPSDALLAVHLSRPKALLDLLAGEDMMRCLRSLPQFAQHMAQPKTQEFLNLVNVLETSLNTDWRTGLRKLTGAGVTLAVCPNDRVLIVIDAEDQRLLEQLQSLFLTFARGEAQKQGRAEVVPKQYAGATIWSFDGNEAHALLGNRLVFANSRESLQMALDLREQGKDESLAANGAFQAAVRAAGRDAVGTAFVNVKTLAGLPQVSRLLNGQGSNPLAALAFAGIVESLRSSTWLALDLQVEKEGLALRALTDGKNTGATSPAAFALPQNSSAGAWPGIVVPGRIAALSLYRDLHRFYAAKDDLFPERTSGLIFFENMMGIFFSGRDLTSEVLAEAEPEIRIVVAEQRYDPAVGTPQVKLPAFAVVLRMRHPQQFKPVMEEAWQKAVGLINFTRGQKALPGLIIDRPVHAGTTFTVGYFSTIDVEDKTKLDQRFNFRPTLAMPGDYLILGSTDTLTRDLIEALGREGEQTIAPLAGTDSLVEIEGAHLASILQDNREGIIRDDMLKKGRSHAEAQANADTLLAVVRLLDQVRLSIGTHEGLTEARLRIKLDLSPRQ